MTDYQVQNGDTLSKIAKTHNMSIKELAELNGIKDPDKIKAGQMLVFSPATNVTGISADLQNDYNDELMTFGWGIRPETVDESPVAPAVAPLSPWAIGGAGAVAGVTATKLYPAAKKGAKNAGRAIKGKAKHMVKSAEQHYAFGKDAVQKGAKNVGCKVKAGYKSAIKVGNTKVAPAILKGAKRFCGPVAAVFAAYDIGKAYKEGGTDAAVKQTVKTGAGLAGGWAGAKVGAAVGSLVGPIGTVVGGVIGGIAGFFLGEKLAS